MNPQADQNWTQAEVMEDDSPEASAAKDPSAHSRGGAEPASNNGSRRPVGKVARLPKADCDRVNIMLRDGVPYAEIIAKIGDLGKNLIPRNVSSWHNGPGYERWLKDEALDVTDIATCNISTTRLIWPGCFSVKIALLKRRRTGGVL